MCRTVFALQRLLFRKSDLERYDVSAGHMSSVKTVAPEAAWQVGRPPYHDTNMKFRMAAIKFGQLILRKINH